MNLPNYFIADVPDAVPSPEMIAEACRALRRNREQYLSTRSTAQLIHVLSEVARNWLQADFGIRRLALEQGPAATGFSRATLAAGLEAFFKQVTPENLHALVVQDLGHAQRLDQMVATGGEQQSSRCAIATAPELLVHVAAGNLPSPALMSLVLGVVLRSAQFMKCASGAALLPRLFAHSLYEADHKLGACIEIAEWRGGQAHLESALFEHADCVSATGSDETLEAVRRQLPARARFVGYGHRASFGYVNGEMLTGPGLARTAARAAADVAAWNQLGCLSPHVIYVEQGGVATPEQFAELLARELAVCETAAPRGELPVDRSAGIASRRSIYELRAANSPETRIWSSPGGTAWTVVYEADPRFQLSCLHRFIYVKPVANLTEALQAADIMRGKISTVGVAAPDHRLPQLATELARWGVTRVCPLGQMQQPPLTWRHDGRPALTEFITWTDWEK